MEGVTIISEFKVVGKEVGIEGMLDSCKWVDKDVVLGKGVVGEEVPVEWSCGVSQALKNQLFQW